MAKSTTTALARQVRYEYLLEELLNEFDKIASADELSDSIMLDEIGYFYGSEVRDAYEDWISDDDRYHS